MLLGASREAACLSLRRRDACYGSRSAIRRHHAVVARRWSPVRGATDTSPRRLRPAPLSDFREGEPARGPPHSRSRCLACRCEEATADVAIFRALMRLESSRTLLEQQDIESGKGRGVCPLPFALCPFALCQRASRAVPYVTSRPGRCMLYCASLMNPSRLTCICR